MYLKVVVVTHFFIVGMNVGIHLFMDIDVDAGFVINSIQHKSKSKREKKSTKREKNKIKINV